MARVWWPCFPFKQENDIFPCFGLWLSGFLGVFEGKMTRSVLFLVATVVDVVVFFGNVIGFWFCELMYESRCIFEWHVQGCVSMVLKLCNY